MFCLFDCDFIELLTWETAENKISWKEALFSVGINQLLLKLDIKQNLNEWM